MLAPSVTSYRDIDWKKSCGTPLYISYLGNWQMAKQGKNEEKLTGEGHSDLLVDGVEDLDLHGVDDGGDDASPSLAPLPIGAVNEVPP